MGYDLRFVHLGITIEHLQNHITIFGFSIAFYGIIIGIGMLLGITLAARDAERSGIGEDTVYDFALLGIVFGVIGARLYYVFFQWDNYRGNLLEILNLRAGGLAIYGGVIGGILSLMVYCRRKKQNFLNLADSLILGVLVGQILGRWGNFFNAEAFGRYTDSLFAMQLRRDIVNPIMINSALLQHLVRVNGVDYIQVHPTFLYESVWNLCLLLFLLWYRPKKRFTGEMFFLYLGGYGLGRVWIEGLRTDSLLVPGTGIAVSQALAGVCVLVALLCILAGRRLAARGRKN
ncbi:prolipoprotein diacylglyceryl transferase [Stomatobaculum longum]|uniref:prolipoprotein diacylglyceryl transferase n=1 Tax=Stomatobaculum longum TaxID=796942 RepID=UPI0028E86743|nr:prolipoprotein diacylglyceryl transferase [Stomatobaculum longum]